MWELGHKGLCYKSYFNDESFFERNSFVSISLLLSATLIRVKFLTYVSIVEQNLEKNIGLGKEKDVVEGDYYLRLSSPKGVFQSYISSG